MELSSNPSARSVWRERRRGRESAGGEGHAPAALAEGLGRRPEGAHEFGVACIKHLESGFRRRVDQRAVEQATESGRVCGYWARIACAENPGSRLLHLTTFTYLIDVTYWLNFCRRGREWPIASLGAAATPIAAQKTS